MPSKHKAGGCNCCEACTDCVDLYALYGYDSLELSGVSGPIDLDSGDGPETWAGFSGELMTIPNAQGGGCDDTIIQSVGMSATKNWYFLLADPVKFYAGTSIKASVAASLTYACDAGIPGRSIGIQVGYAVTGNVAAQFSESSFTDWTWSSVGSQRKAVKTFSDGSIATWFYQPLDAFRTTIAASIRHDEADLTAGNPAVLTLSIPSALPYDYLGILIGTVTIS
jgi:hypothetical protein